ncbi:MAG TPA: FAD-binding oxidoreductase [Aestuariivirgaceae bacterium]|jgi:glycine/D-amino acid oxidase-like deaminating enzyme
MRAEASIFTEGCRLEPYWWRAAPHDRAPPVESLPKSADVAIVGSGITGIAAALHLAEAGRSVVVIDAKEPGYGASTRNAGYVGRMLKHTFGEIANSHGLSHAIAIYRELMQAFRSVGEAITKWNIQCCYRTQGRFLMATSPAMYEAMVREFELRAKHLGEEFSPVSRSDQKSEIQTSHYQGGVRIEDHAGLHPGLYHRGLLEAARRLGVIVRGFTPVTAIGGQEGDHEVKTQAGTVEARQVLVATNGYTGDLIPWLKRRIMPFDAYVITTEQLDKDLVAKLLPTDRTYIDWNFNVDYIRRAPDDPSRIVFGGLTGERVSDLRAMAKRLHARLVRIFPHLAGARIDNVWTGRCAGTFDLYPHLGTHNGIHYALGYCFAGVPMGTWFGLKSAQRILGVPHAPSVFAERSMTSHPLYWGNPWFVPLAIRIMSRHDH